MSSYAELLAAAASDPLIALEVGPSLLAPPLMLGQAVLAVRETQLGFAGAVAVGPPADVEALLRSSWREHPGWAQWRSITADRVHHAVLVDVGARGLGTWDTLSIRPGALVRRALPAGVAIDRGIGRVEARAFVAEHHTTRWITPEPDGELWVALRSSARGTLLATGLASMTPAGATRLTSIAVHRAVRGRGLGWAVTQALVEVGFARSEAVVLGVDEANLIGGQLYRAMGFRLDHELVSGLLPELDD